METKITDAEMEALVDEAKEYLVMKANVGEKTGFSLDLVEAFIQLKAERDALRHDIDRHLHIANNLAQENQKLRERLEITHYYNSQGEKIPVPEGEEITDGISCRDETIRMLEEEVND